MLSNLITALQRLRTTAPADRPLLVFGIADGAALYGVAFLVSAILGVLRQILFNAQFGLSEEAAAYYAAFRLPETIGALIAGGTLTNALVPMLLRVEARDGEQAAQRLLNLALCTLLAGLMPLAILAAIFAPAFVGLLLAPGLDPATQALTVVLGRIMLLEVLLVATEGALAAVLISRGQLLLPALAIAARNVTLIGGILLADIPGVGIYGPTIGAILDALLQLAILVPGLRRRGYRPMLIWEPRNRDLRATLRMLGPNALSAVTNYAGGIVDTAFAGIAGGAAALGAVTNATLLIGLPTRLLGATIGQSALPYLSLYHIQQNHAAARRILYRALAVAVSLAILAALALYVLGRPLIQLLFERGRFDAAAGDLTYAMLTAFALGLPAYVITEVAGRALIARMDTRTPFLANLAQLILRVILILLLLDPSGPRAIPLAFALSSAAEALLLLLALRRKQDAGYGTQ